MNNIIVDSFILLKLFQQLTKQLTQYQKKDQILSNPNRLEHTIKNLDTAAENLQASESRTATLIWLRIINSPKLNILNQAAQTMLAKANQNQSILQLLR